MITWGRRSDAVFGCGTGAGRHKHDTVHFLAIVYTFSGIGSIPSDDRGLLHADLEPHAFLVSCQQESVLSDATFRKVES